MTDRQDPLEVDTLSYIRGFQAGWRNGEEFASLVARISVRQVYPDDPLLDLFEAEYQQALDTLRPAA